METSYNGWPAYPDITSRTVPFAIDGIPFVGGIVNNPDVITVMTYVLTRFHREVERLKSPGCWGGSYRKNRNAENLSCHSSATALDANAPAHPNGIEASENFSPAQIAKIHEILASVDELDEVIHWGGDWHRADGLTPDPMHYEVHDHDLAKLHRVAERIRALSSSSKQDKKKRRQRAVAALAAIAAFVSLVTGVVQKDTGEHGRPVVGQTQRIDVFVWNEKSFPVMSSSAYREDFAKVMALGGKRAVFLHSEMSAPNEVTIFRNRAHRLGFELYGVRKGGDVAISTRGLDRGKTKRIQLADKPAGPNSGPRWFVAVEQHTVGPVALIAFHLTNGCFAHNASKPWYTARCDALHAQIRLMKRIVAYLLAHDIAVVLGGDENNDIVTGGQPIQWAPGQVDATGHGKQQLAGISSEHVQVALTRARPVRIPLHTDHRVLQAQLTVTAR